jgi:TP901 family phage tail tape measure protein
MTAFYTPLRLLQDAISQIITIDTQLTSLARVTDEQTDLNQVLEESIKLADQLGNKVVEINEGLIEFARQGFSGNDLLKITEFATLMANVSDLTVQEAASSLTAAIKGFSMEAEQAIHVVDALNEVDLNNKSPMSVMT